MEKKTEKKTADNAKLVMFDCPPELFDVDGAYVMRRKRVPVWRVNAIKEVKRDEDLYTHLAVLIPCWQGVVDVDTGELLPNPEEDQAVFDRLDVVEQLPWLAEILQRRPGDPKSGRSRT